MAQTSPLAATTVPPSVLKWFSALVGLTSLSILVQAIVAGEFVSQDHRKYWIELHGTVAYFVIALALATMVFTIVKLRRTKRAILLGSIVLFVLVVVQVELGHEITDNKQDWLIGIHVPLAFIIFGIAVWLPINTTMLRRSASKAA
jgi:lipopolysaccharide export LptBFGC system permease protein LptF